MRCSPFTLIPLVGSLALALAATTTAATTVYKWVDENGVVHYSDQPHADAQKVQVQAPQTYKSAEAAAAASVPAGMPAPPPLAPPPSYQGCAIAQPTDDQVLLNVESLTIIVRTDPTLQPGDKVFLMMDGQPLNKGAATGAQYVLAPVDRGTHTLQAVVRSSDGGLMCQTPGVTFDARQSSVLAPANPLRPR